MGSLRRIVSLKVRGKRKSFQFGNLSLEILGRRRGYGGFLTWGPAPRRLGKVKEEQMGFTILEPFLGHFFVK